MNPRAYLLRSPFPTLALDQEVEDLGLYPAAASRHRAESWHLLRLDGLSPGQVRRVKETARRLECRVEDVPSFRHGEGWCEGLALHAAADRIERVARALSGSEKPIAEALDRALDLIAGRPVVLRLRSGRRRLTGGAGIAAMGILNVTPDSFSDGGRYSETSAALDQAERLAGEGASLIDVGGESTRPGAAPVPVDEELRRVVPVIEALRKRLDPSVTLSVDTMKAEVARAAIDAGAEIINDVSAMTADPEMAAVVARGGVHVILNHMRGAPSTMQRSPGYRHAIPEIIADLALRMEEAGEAGVGRDRILLDPGIGFGKRPGDNVCILRHIAAFASLGRPVVLGVSRKSFLGVLSPDEGPASEGRREATMVAEAIAASGGAHILRTHEPARALCAARIATPRGATQNPGEHPRIDDHESGVVPSH